MSKHLVERYNATVRKINALDKTKVPFDEMDCSHKPTIHDCEVVEKYAENFANGINKSQAER